jgi:hypothetical protein
MAAWTLAASLVTLRREVDAAHPGRSKASDGTLGDAAHAARESDHNPDAAGVVRAWDCTSWYDPVRALNVADDLAEHLRAGRDPRVKYVIRRSRIFSSEIQPWVWRPYSGTNPHDAHVHISVQPHPSGDDGSPWSYGVDVPLTQQEKTEIAQLAARLTTDTLLARVITTGWQADGTYDKAKPVQLSLGQLLTETRGGALGGSNGVGKVLAAIALAEGDSVSRILAAIAGLPSGGVAGDLTDAELARIAVAVADESARRQQE